jgi:hypothetical protein
MNTNRITVLVCSAVACLGLSMARRLQADATTIYVSPGGNDAWSGKLPDPKTDRSDGPLATPLRARDLVRTILANSPGQPVHVELRRGLYFLNEPLTLSPADSGTEKAPVVWSAYRDEHPVLSGGVLLTGWQRTKVNGRDVWVAKLPGGDKAPAIRELWLAGTRLSRARWPKQGTLSVVGLSDNEKHDNSFHGVTEFRFAGADVKNWPTVGDGEAIVATRWVESHLPITSVDEANHVIHFGKRSVFALDPDDQFWIENVKEHLTMPGDFYVDPREKAVYLRTPAGPAPDQAQIVAPRLAQVLRLVGKPEAGQFVHHITFRGIGIAHAEWYFDHAIVGQQDAASAAAVDSGLKPDPSRSGFSQAAIGVTGAVWGRGVQSCTFDNCTISHTGTYGIELGQGCKHNRISHCTLTDLGAGGVKIGEVAIRGNSNEQTSGNEISDCVIADGGNLFPSCVAIWIGQSPQNTIAHNDIHGFWYTAISIGWTWGYAGSAAQRNVVEFNHIHHIGKKTDGASPILSDMGCVYTLGDQEGTVIRNNRFHDVAGLKYGGWGIYFDEGTTHILAENNLVYGTTHGGFHQHYGKENTFQNNIIAFGRDAQIQRTRVENHQSFRFERNIVYWDRGPLFAGDWSSLNVGFDGNTYWRVESGDIRFANLSWAEWQKAGMDRHSKIADPHLGNPAGRDFQLTAAAPEALAGFVPFDLSTVGPR